MHDWRRLVREHLRELAPDPAREAEIVEEMAQHLEDRYQTALSTGRGKAEAFQEILNELKAPELARAQIRRLEPNRIAPLPPNPDSGVFESVRDDLVFAIRLVARNWAFSSFIVLILAVGIASATAIFSVVNGLLLRPLPFTDSEQLMVLGHPDSAGRPGVLGFATIEDWRASAESFETIAAIRSWLPTLLTDEGAERISAVRVSASYFELLGARPAYGDDFEPGHDRPDADRVAILSHGLWARQFRSDPGIIGKSISLNDEDYRVIGIMPEGFDDLMAGYLYYSPDLWSPLAYDVTLPWACRSCQHLKGVGRLRSDVSLQEASAELAGIQTRLNREHPSEYDTEESAVASPLQREMSYAIRPALNVLSASVVFIFVISLANVSNMFLARGMRRRKELSVRTAIGAKRSRLFRQLQTENLIYGLSGGALGLLLTPLAVRGLWRLAPPSVLAWNAISIHWPVIVFALVLAVGSSVISGLAPALLLMRHGLLDALRQDGRVTAATSARRVRRGQKLLVALDLTIAMVLICGSLLMVRTVRNLLDVNPGFESERLLTGQISLLGSRYEVPSAIQATVDQLLERIETLPGVNGVAAASQMPLAGNWDAWGIRRSDQLEHNPSDAPFALLYIVTPSYFDVMGMELMAGRRLGAIDREGAPEAVVVSESTAAALWPGVSPLGKRIRIGGDDDAPWWTIVGVVNDVHHKDLMSSPAHQIYVPLAQRPSSYLTLAIRTGSNTVPLAPLVRSAIAEVASDIPLYEVAEMKRLVADKTAEERFVSLLLSVFAAIALLLTGAGIYGLASYTVAQRAPELGLRVALGADRLGVIQLVLGNGLHLTLVGLTGGLMLVYAAAPWLRQLLFGVEPLDPATVLLSAVVLVITLLLGHLFPVLRALRVDPATVLRGD